MATTGSNPETPAREAGGAARGYSTKHPDTGRCADSGKAERWKRVKSADIVFARSICLPEQWEALKAQARQEGTAEEGLEAEATRRWRADRILRGLPVGEEMNLVA